MKKKSQISFPSLFFFIFIIMDYILYIKNKEIQFQKIRTLHKTNIKNIYI